MTKLLGVAVVMASLSPFAAFAGNSNSHPGWSIGVGNPHGSAPAPIIGAGLPALAVAGIGYLFLRRKGSQNKD
jgi:hypothetical protein